MQNVFIYKISTFGYQNMGKNNINQGYNDLLTLINN